MYPKIPSVRILIAATLWQRSIVQLCLVLTPGVQEQSVLAIKYIFGRYVIEVLEGRGLNFTDTQEDSIINTHK